MGALWDSYETHRDFSHSAFPGGYIGVTSAHQQVGGDLTHICTFFHAPIHEVSQALQRIGVYVTEDLIIGRIPTEREWAMSH